MSHAVDLLLPFDNTANVRYQTTGLEIVNTVEVQLLGILSDSSENEAWIEFVGPSPQWRSRTLTEAANQHLTGKFCLPLPGASNLSGVFLPCPLRVAYEPRGGLRLPMSLSVNYYDRLGSPLTHSGVLYMRFYTNTPQ